MTIHQISETHLHFDLLRDLRRLSKDTSSAPQRVIMSRRRIQHPRQKTSRRINVVLLCQRNIRRMENSLSRRLITDPAPQRPTEQERDKTVPIAFLAQID